MKAAVLRTIPGNLEVEDIQIDKPGPHEVLIRTAAAGVCHSDLHFAEGKYVYPTPCVLGHEISGTVAELGSGVAGLASRTARQYCHHVETCA